MRLKFCLFPSVCLLSLAALFFSNCSEEDGSAYSTEDIEGTWYCKRAGYNKNFYGGGDSRVPCTCVITSDTIEFKSANFPKGSLKEDYELEKSTVHVVYNLETDTDLFDITVNSDGTLSIGSKTDNGFIIHGTYKKI